MKKTVSGIMLSLLVISTFTLAFNIQPAKAEPAIILVPDDYPTIQAAINAASPGDTVFVKNGTYYEHLVVTKRVLLIGEEKETTIIDGRGTGTVIQIGANNVSITNFTIRNGGHGLSWLDSCIYGNYHGGILIENNIIMNATNGIIFYGFFNSTIRHNHVEEFGSMGLHLDGYSANCTIEGNTVINCLEGIELEVCAGNLIEGNQLISNNASVFLNRCTRQNVFKKNSMTGDWYNLVVWGSTLEAFIQDIDTSNTVNNKTVYYITNSNDLLVEPSSYPNMGYLAVVNCTNITVNDIDLSLNKDGLLMAHSSNCSLVNITLSGNLGPLLFGGLTFFRSNNNSILNSKINNNSVGVCLCQSNSNTFYLNAFVDNNIQVVSNFYSPLSPPSGSYSINRWDNGFEGNYWSDYSIRYPDAEELDDSGIWDTPYEIDENNQDNYPLIEPWTPLPRTLGELKTKIEEFGSEGEIDNQGIAKSLIAKLGVAQKLVDKQKIDEAKIVLEGFILQVQELSGIHITVEAADVLIKSAEYIIPHF